MQKTVSLYLRWDTGPADLLKKIQHLNLNRIWSLPDRHLNRKLTESFSLKELHRRVFLSQTVSVLKYLIPAVPCLTWQEEQRYILPVGSPILKKLQRSGCHHQITISPRPILTLHVCDLQPSAYFYKDPPMGRIRILDSVETARP